MSSRPEPILLAQELLRVKDYPFNNGRCGETALRAWGLQDFTYRKASEWLIHSTDAFLLSIGLWAYTRCAPPNSMELQLPDGRSEKVKDILVEAIRLNPELSYAFNTLSARMQDFATKKRSTEEMDIDNYVRLADGRCLDSRELLIEAIRLGPTVSLFFDNLAGLLSEKESAVLHDGRKLSRNELFVEAIRLDPSDIYTYVNFASVLTATKIVTLHDGRSMTHVDLACEALNLNPKFGAAYYSIAAKMRETSPEVEFFQQKWSQRMLCLEALKYSPDMYQPYIVLARMTKPGQVVTLHDQRQLSRAQLFVQAAKFDVSGFVMKNVSEDDKKVCLWTLSQHKAFGAAFNRAVAALLLGLGRLCDTVVPMDPAVLTEMLQQWSLFDSFELTQTA